MDRATTKRLLLTSAAIAIVLGLFRASGAPTKRCYLLPYRTPMPTIRQAIREVRNKYEDLRKEAPWQNCSVSHLRPTWKLQGMTERGQLEALKMLVNLSVQVLQNRSEPLTARDTSQVEEILQHLQEDLRRCISHKPSGHKDSKKFHEFKEQFQKFKDSNMEQSPKCLEAAVGLNIARLVNEDLKHVITTSRRRTGA